MQQWEQPTVLEEPLAVVAEGVQIHRVLPQLEVPMEVVAGEGVRAWKAPTARRREQRIGVLKEARCSRIAAEQACFVCRGKNQAHLHCRRRLPSREHRPSRRQYRWVQCDTTS